MKDVAFERPSLTDVAYQEIRNSILIGSILPGQKLVVNDLVDRWQISNTPIKEALNRLVAEGLVEAVPRRGMRVRLPSARELREFFEIRILYETHCCRLAVDRIDDNKQVLEELRSTLDKSRDILTDERSYLMQFQFDEIFHMLLVGLSGNETLIKDFDKLHANILIVGIHASKRAPLRRQEETFKEHEKVLRGLVERSPEIMVEAMREHLGNTADSLLRLYHPDSGRIIKK